MGLYPDSICSCYALRGCQKVHCKKGIMLWSDTLVNGPAILYFFHKTQSTWTEKYDWTNIFIYKTFIISCHGLCLVYNVVSYQCGIVVSSLRYSSSMLRLRLRLNYVSLYYESFLRVFITMRWNIFYHTEIDSCCMEPIWLFEFFSQSVSNHM